MRRATAVAVIPREASTIALPSAPVPAPAPDIRPRETAPPAGAAARLRHRLLVLLGAFAFWTLLGLFFATQIMLLEPRATWGQALLFSMPRWYSWGLLTPGIIAVDRWMGTGRSLRARVAWHLPLALAWTGLAIALRLFNRLLTGAPWPSSIASFVLERAYWDLLIYAVIAGFAVARAYAAQAREQERETHRLTLEAAALQAHLAEARLHSLRAQLQPHFLFNALNTISAFTETDPKTARRLMEQLGQLLRVSLRHATTPVVALAEELTFLDDYLAIESARFGDRITITVRADDAALEAAVPSFLLQPLVENAIRHGVGPRLSGGQIAVTCVRDGARLRLRVRDNGLGLSPDWPSRRDAGVGLRNVAARLRQLYPDDHAFDVTPDPAGGVDIRIDLPWRASSLASTQASLSSPSPGAAAVDDTRTDDTRTPPARAHAVDDASETGRR